MIFAFLAVLAYGFASLLVIPALVRAPSQPATPPSIKTLFSVGLIAVWCHLTSLSPLLFGLTQGIHLTLANIGSLVSVIISALVTLALPKWRSFLFAVPVAYLVGILSMALAYWVDGSFISHIEQNRGLLLHLSISIFAYAFFAIALVYAIQLNWLSRRLKNKKLGFSSVLPPLMTVEKHFFALTLLAQILLTASLLTGMVYLHDFFAPSQIHKAILAMLSWLVYSVLLLGQWKWHWRGKKVLILSISGMILLTLGYFVSRLLV